MNKKSYGWCPISGEVITAETVGGGIMIEKEFNPKSVVIGVGCVQRTLQEFHYDQIGKPKKEGVDYNKVIQVLSRIPESKDAAVFVIQFYYELIKKINYDFGAEWEKAQKPKSLVVGDIFPYNQRFVIVIKTPDSMVKHMELNYFDASSFVVMPISGGYTDLISWSTPSQQNDFYENGEYYNSAQKIKEQGIFK